MPPKRKAAAAKPAEEPPASRRRTRATARAQSPGPAPPQRTQTRRRGAIQQEPEPSRKTVRTASPEAEADEIPATLLAAKVVRTYGRQTRTKRPPGVRVLPEQVTVKAPKPGESDVEDESVPAPRTKRQPPAKTPPPRTRSTRYVLHSVEIASPRLPTLPKPISPPASPSRKPARVVPYALPPSPAPPQTPTPASRQSPIPSPSQTRKASKRVASPPTSPSRLPAQLPAHLLPCLHSQRRAILALLQKPSIRALDDNDQEPTPNQITARQLKELLTGTVERGEGNSCLLIGPRGSGKTRIVEGTVAALSMPPIVIRLSGYAQSDDRLALREIASQLAQQTGHSYDLETSPGEDEDDNPFTSVDPSIPLPPPSHLPTLISSLPSLARPSIVILEAFDLFALHGRQALLYCLLDTAQSCRASNSSKGIAVVGVTTRVDTVNLLEKRVKSRFSGRMLRTAGPADIDEWTWVARNVLSAPIADPTGEWEPMWSQAVERFLSERSVKEALLDTFSLTKDVRMLTQILTGPILSLSPESPFPTASHLSVSVSAQRCPPTFPFLPALPYPGICLLIAAVHAGTAGHESVTFEMLHESFRTQVRTSQSAPVQVDGGSIGMVRCSREVLMAAFEHLVSVQVFSPMAGTSSYVAREFVRHRCMVERDAVKKAVDASGQTNLKKWFNRAQ